MKIIKRPTLISRLMKSLSRSPVTALLGPRQCGKTTLARAASSRISRVHFFDLESERDQARLSSPQRALEKLRGLVVLDEIQRAPRLMPILRVLADRRPNPCRFLILGSASPELAQKSSETLAGRVEFVEMGGFSLDEIGERAQDFLWLRGGFPRSFLAARATDSRAWRENFIKTFLQRDFPQMGIRIPSAHLLRFWRMTAHLHGQFWNGAQIAGSLGVSHPTSRHYLDILTGAFMIRQLPPWHENAGKRIVKAPKIYLRDSGILHALLGLWSRDDLEGYPQYGFSWEGFALEQILSRWGDSDAYFWATHAGAELDLLLVRGEKRWGFEFKAGEAPTATKSMRVALSDLRLNRLWVIYPGKERYPLDQKIECLGLGDALKLKI